MDPVLRIIREAELRDLEEYSCCFFPAQYDNLDVFLNSLNESDRSTCLRACLLFFRVTNGKVPRQFQLESTLAVMSGRDSVIIAGTGSGKTVCMMLPLLLDPGSISVVISPLKRLQMNQVRSMYFLRIQLTLHQVIEFENIGIRAISVNEDTPKDRSFWKVSTLAILA
jgi:Lhr-like helicase